MEGETIEFAASPQVRKSVWAKIDAYRDTTAWPKKKSECKAALKMLRGEHKEWPDRIAAVEKGFALKTDGEVPGWGEEL